MSATSVTAHEPILDIAHLDHVELLTPKPEESLWFFHDVLGMEEVHRAGDSVYLRCYGDYQKFSLKLTAAKQPGIARIGWRVVSPQALERRAAAIEAQGLGRGWCEGDFGFGRTFRFEDPDGHPMEIFFEQERYVAPPDMRSSLKNQPARFTGRGVGAKRIDHLAVLCGDVEKNRRFMIDTLGFQLREQVLFNEGKTEIGSWMSVTPIHHNIAYVKDAAAKGRSGRLHHFSMWVDNRDDVLRAADLYRENGIFIEAGPSRHNLSQAFYLYAYEPGGNRIEVYSGGYLVFAPDYEPVTWNEAERGPGVHWGQPLPPSFGQYATPPVPLEPAAAGEEAKVPAIDPL
ncbi:MAG TPA: catechol 2,3-dioxygenase [Azospirillum sp.]